MLCANIGWYWLSGSGEEDFLISSTHFRYFVIISLWKRVGPFIWNWLGGTGEDENVESVQTEGRRTTGDQESSFELSVQVSWKIMGRTQICTERKTDGQRERQTDRETDRQSDSYISPEISVRVYTKQVPFSGRL